MIGRVGSALVLLWLAAAILAEVSGCAVRLDLRRVRIAGQDGGASIEYRQPF